MSVEESVIIGTVLEIAEIFASRAEKLRRESDSDAVDAEARFLFDTAVTLTRGVRIIPDGVIAKILKAAK